MFILLAILTGLGGGFISGVFGGGSGLIFVPGFYHLLHGYDVATSHLMQITIATGMACSIFLGITATRTQIRYRYVNFDMLKRSAPGMVLGIIVGVTLLVIIPSVDLKRIFGVAVILIAIWLWRYKSDREKHWTLPYSIHNAIFFLIAVLSNVLGVSVFTVPYLIKSGLDIKQAIGTATVFTALSSLVSACLMIVAGFFATGHLPRSNLGYVNLLILIAAGVPSAFAAILGVKLVHRLPHIFLKYGFSSLMVIVGVLMLLS